MYELLMVGPNWVSGEIQATSLRRGGLMELVHRMHDYIACGWPETFYIVSGDRIVTGA